jgi:predicted metal-dependent HD superfamily phosphohydrolase
VADLASIAQSWSPLLDGLDELPDLLPELAARYTEPHRAYHGIDHIAALARLFVEVDRGPTWHAPLEVQLAILFHDAIYEPGRPDNEDRSADLATSMLRDRPIAARVDVTHVDAMIRATKTHDRLTDPNDHDLAHFIDTDMSILGAPPPVYDAYAQAVRREFSAIPDALFNQGRETFLKKQLTRESLFHTPWFRARFDAQARANLERELLALAGHRHG